METYLDRIKKIKNEQKLTNDQLAERSGIPLGTLSKILAGMSDSPKLSSMIALCGALGCSLEYIVSGTPENDHNYTLSLDEIALIEDYRTLDSWGKSLVDTVLEKEVARTASLSDGVSEEALPAHREKQSVARILPTPMPVNRYAGEPTARTGKRPIPLYDIPASAGTGFYLDNAVAETIKIPNNEKTADANYALRISGNSMEPKYHSGDTLLVQNTDSIESGELGIFTLDGDVYFKVYGGDRLISLNPTYAPILLKEYTSVQCRGRVIGRLKRK
ncbi:MAG: helix-turn-helix domain-containing protein [Ruminococcaceae bacterium]|nr:helix-turn-helix domain-containing protein [Oscillospiraceae bacterium]